jgi:putative sterol carrier protein
LHFATRDTNLSSLDATAVSAHFVNRQMSRTRSRRVVLLLDCCYSGAFAEGLFVKADENLQLVQQFEGRGRAIITASKATEYSFEGARLAHSSALPSVFTSALVQGLATGQADLNNDGQISLDELYEYTYDEVKRGTAHQTPSKWVLGIEGSLILAKSIRGSTLPSELVQVISHPLVRVRLAVVSELAEILQNSDVQPAATAEVMLIRLQSSDPEARVREAAASALSGIAAIPSPRPNYETRAPSDQDNVRIHGLGFAALSAVVKRNSNDSLIAAIQQQMGGIEVVLDEAFAGMVDSFNPAKAVGQRAAVQYEIAAPGGTRLYAVSLAEGRCEVDKGRAESPRVTLRIGLADFLRLITGNANSMQLFMVGKLKVSGDLFFYQTYQSWFDRPEP